jgi:hypothetical protein
MPRTYTLTYDCVTPESAEDGDFSDCGFGRSPSDGTSTREGACIDGNHAVRMAALAAASDAATEEITADEDEKDEHMDLEDSAAESRVCVDKIVALIRRHYGATEPSCCPEWCPGTWYTTPDGSTDYRTGEVTRVSVHLDGWTEAEECAIYAAVTGRK